MTLTAVFGELPVSQLSYIPRSNTYTETVMTKLKKGRWIRPYCKNHISSYRLTAKAKAYLLEDNPARFQFYLGSEYAYTSQNSKITKRLRLHCVAQTLLTMLHAGVFVYRDQKPELFSPLPVSLPTFPYVAFYASREVKAVGEEAVPIRSSRMVGVLLNGSGIFVTYNCVDAAIKLKRRAELRAKSFFEMILCEKRLAEVYDRTDLHGLILGNDIDLLYQLLTSQEQGTRALLYYDSGYAHFYYLTHDHYGTVLLQFLSRPALRHTFDAILMQGLSPADEYAIHNGIDEQGQPVLFAYLPDIPYLLRFAQTLEAAGENGHIICFDFQANVLRRFFGPGAQIETIDFSKFEGRFFPSQTKTD